MVLEKAMRGSSTSGNLSTYSVILTKDQNKKKQLAKFHYNQSMVTEAPVILTFLADCNRFRRWLKVSKAKDGFNELNGFIVSAIDSIILAQSMALAFESMGMGICYMGTTIDSISDITKFFDLPDTVVPVTTLAVGYPDEAPSIKNRLGADSILHIESYKNYTDEDITEIHEEKDVTGWNRYKSSPGMDKLFKEHSIENMAQFYVSDLKYAPKDNEASALRIIETLKTQDFYKSFLDK